MILNENRGEFEGWPKTINQLENFNSSYDFALPKLIISNVQNAVVEVENEQTGELVFILRIVGNEYQPIVKNKGTYTIRVYDTKKEIQKVFLNLKATKNKTKKLFFWEVIFSPILFASF